MTWEYALIGLVVGIIIGAVAMRFGNRKLRQQQALQFELEKNKQSLKSIVKSWSVILPAALNCWITWPMITASCISTWLKAPAVCCRIPWRMQTRSAIAWQNQKLVTIRLRSRCRAIILKAHPACCAVAQNATDLSLPAKILSGALSAPASTPHPSYYLIIDRIVSRLKIQ